MLWEAAIVTALHCQGRSSAEEFGAVAFWYDVEVEEVVLGESVVVGGVWTGKESGFDGGVHWHGVLTSNSKWSCSYAAFGVTIILSSYFPLRYFKDTSFVRTYCHVADP